MNDFKQGQGQIATGEHVAYLIGINVTREPATSKTPAKLANIEEVNMKRSAMPNISGRQALRSSGGPRGPQ